MLQNAAEELTKGINSAPLRSLLIKALISQDRAINGEA